MQGDSAASVFGGFGYTRFLRENLAGTFAVDGIAVSSGINISSTLAATGTAAALSIPAGIRWNPLRGDHTTQALKPFVAVGIGPVIGIADASFVSGLAVSAGSTVRATLGGQVGGGIDVFAGRSFSLGITVTYNKMINFSEPVGAWRNFNGPQAALGIGWLLQ